MTNLIEKTFLRLGEQLSGRLSRPGEDRYASATATWAKQVGVTPRAVAHCRTAEEVQQAVRAARECDLPLSVRGGGHDWAGRALCPGIVIDLSGLNGVAVETGRQAARISGGARASEVLAVTDPLGLAAVTGSCGGVGMAGFTSGGGYGPLIGRFGLALDNLLAADIVLADGRIVTASDDGDRELFWALRGGGGNFGVVTAMRYRLHELPAIRSGVLLFPFAEARAVFEACVHIVACAPDELSVQLGLVAGPDGAPAVMVVPTWSGLPEQGEARLAPFFQLGTLLAGAAETMTCGGRLAMLDPFVASGQRVHMETA
jgi:FAD/FMN-containing dehydrogenase